MTPEQWLLYANQGAVRNKPLDPRLVDALSFLPSMGVTMQVVSGGQDALGEGDQRTGSTRHDHGGAADADFYKDGRKLVPSNPEDAAILSQIVSQARANGVTGFGEGADYMGEGRVHLGFGPEAVWGAGGKGANAPDWLKTAFYGSGQQQPMTYGALAPTAPPEPQADPSLFAGLAGLLSGEGAPDGDYSDGLKGLGAALMQKQQQAPAIMPMQAQPFRPKRREVSDSYLKLFQTLRG